jgi:ribosomal 50S subunit-recycling heat shock protein
MINENEEIHIRGRVYKKSYMTEDQLDLESRIAQLLEEARIKSIESQNAEAAAKYYIEKLDKDLQSNNNAVTLDGSNSNDIMFLTMR